MADYHDLKLTELGVPHTGKVTICNRKMDGSSEEPFYFFDVFWDYNGDSWSASVKVSNDNSSTCHLPREVNARLLCTMLHRCMNRLAEERGFTLEDDCFNMYFDDSEVPFKDAYIEDYCLSNSQYAMEVDVPYRNIRIYRNGVERVTLVDRDVSDEENMAQIFLHELRSLNALLLDSTFEGEPYKELELGTVMGYVAGA